MATPINFNTLKKPVLLAIGALIVLTGAYCVIFPGNNPLTFVRSKLKGATPSKDETTEAPVLNPYDTDRLYSAIPEAPPEDRGILANSHDYIQ